jgi:hypothetical protein
MRTVAAATRPAANHDGFSLMAGDLGLNDVDAYIPD